MRKFLRFLVILLIVLFCLFMLLIVAFKVRNALFLGSAEKEYVEYLNRNKKIFDGTTFFHEGSRDFFGGREEGKVILLGENHGHAEVQEVDKSLLIYLNRTKGVRYYVAEIDSLKARRLNAYLAGEIRNDSLLRSIVADSENNMPQQAVREMFDKWSDIYDYNRTLPDSMRISVIGVDIVPGTMEKIDRDRAMAANFIAAVRERGLERESFYGLFGLFHVLQEAVNTGNVHPFAALLKEAGFGVESIACMDLDSEMYLPGNKVIHTPESGKTKWMGMDGPIILVKGIYDLKAASRRNTITLFALNRDRSPYRNSRKLTGARVNIYGQEDMVPSNESAVTTDFVQYVILLRDAGATTPLK